MVKRNIKLFSWLLAGLFFSGLAGLFIALVDLNAKYETKQERLGTLSSQVQTLQFKLADNGERLAKFDFMEYKTTAFSRRYPQFSLILDTVYRKSHEYGFKPNLVLGVVKVESNYNPAAVSYRGAYGLMQINLAVWRKALNIDKNRIFDVEYNLDLGLQVLRHYYDETRGNLSQALHLYNNGYRYNNTSYSKKVDSTVLSFNSSPIDWHSLGL